MHMTPRILGLLSINKLQFLIYSLANSPSLETDSDASFSLNRRSSSGGLLSPEVDMSGTSTKTTPLGEVSESEGLYLMKKDSQRRTTLSKVLTHDEAKICDVWMDKIIENNHKVEVVIGKSHLKILIESLKHCIIEESNEMLETAIGQVKKSLDFDPTAIHHLHLALYTFQVNFELF